MSRNNLNRKLKYSIRKKKNGGGAASFIVGSVVLGGLMLGGATTVNADGVTQTGTTGTGSQTDTSAKPGGSTDISGTEVTLPKSNTVGTPANQKEDVPAVRSDNVVSKPTMNQNKSGSTENSENLVDPTNEKQTANETTGTKSSDTDVKNDNLTQSPTNARKPVATAATVPESQLANNKITISNFKVNKHVIRESKGLDINFSFDWSGQGLVKGDTLVVPLSDAFTSVNRQVSLYFGSNGQQVGTMVLDYDAKKIYTTFTADMDPNKVYDGTINVGTFVNRNYFRNKDNRDIVELDLPNGQKETVDLQIIFDVKDEQPDLGTITVQADKTTDNPDGSINITWDAIVNSDNHQMSDAAIYVTPDAINKINPQFTVPGNIRGYNYSPWTDMNFEYDSNSTYSLNKDSFRVYQANVYASMGYAKEKELEKDKDYKILKSSDDVMPHAYVIYLIGDYAKTSSPIVVEYSGTLPAKKDAQATTDAFVAYYEGPINSEGTRYDGPFSANWSHAFFNVNKSSITSDSQNVLGSVDVKYVDTEGNVLPGGDLKKVKDNAPVGEDYTTEEKSFKGYHFVGMDKTSDAAKGHVEEGTKHVVYVYAKDPEEKKGSVDVKYVDTEGNILPGGDLKTVKDNAPVGEDYTTEEKSFKGYHFVGMDKTSDAAKGHVEEGTKHVVYVYAKDPEEKKGSVDVKYVDTEGNILPGGDLKTVKDNAPVGEDYTTEEKSFKGYHFVGMDKTSDAAKGHVEEGTKHVVYVYAKDPEEKKGSVDVKYVDTEGNILPGGDLKTVKDNAPVGEDYTTEEKSFKGYHFVGMDKTSDAAKGHVEEGTKHVVYVYAKDPEEKKGSVDVKYVDTEGNILPGGDLKTVKDNAPVGEDYTTEEKSFKGYHFVGMDKTSDAAKGHVEEGTKHVVYVYAKDPEEKKGSVDVKYVDTEGNILPGGDLKTVKDNAPVGEDYTTEEKSFKGYHFVGMDKTSDAAKGHVEEGTKHVVYVYAKDPEEKKGSVDVKYVDTEGNILPGGDLKTVKDNAPVGEDYTTEEKSFKGYHFVGMDKTSDAAKGHVEEGTKHVVYVYAKDPEEKKGSVDVKYVDTEGNILPGGDLKTVKDNAPVGEDYTTEEKSFKGYHFVGMDKTSDAAKGHVEEGTKHVVYVYAKDPEEKKGSVDVKYVDTEGNILPGGDLKTVKDNAPVGEDYTTEEKSFKGYHFVGMDKTSDAAKGHVEEGTKHVVYVYAKDPEEKKGSVDVKYVDTEGNILPGGDLKTVKDNAPVGEDYTTEEKSFKGYHFVGMDKTSDAAKGHVEEGTKHVVYVYAKDPEEKKGSVDVKYVDTEGNILPGGDLKTVKDNAPVGEDYTTEEKSFKGYHFVGMDKTSDAAKGHVEEGTKHVVYVYAKDPEEKKGSVDVKYVTTDGKVLEDVTKVKDNAPVGEAYTTEEKSFDGYHFVGMDKASDSANGKVTEGDKHVVYVYEKDVTPEVKKGSVDVKYVTTDGKVLEDVTKVKDNAPVGEEYTTEEKSFDGYHFVGMDKTSDSANGKVTEGDKHVVYVYEKDVTPEVKKGSVDVKYVTTDGKVLEDVTKVKDNAPVGEAYTTEEKSFDGYHFVGMDKASDSANGKVTEGDKHVVYVYEKNPETPTPEVKKGSVDVKYVTTDGKVLEDVTKVKDNVPVGESYTTEEKSFDGYHFVGMDKTSDSANGKVTEGDKHVVYVYEKNPETPTPEVKKGSVDVKYVTTDGKVLEDVTKVKDNAPVGEAYTTEEKSFDGYHFVGMDKTSDSANGKVTEGDKHVVYVYEKNPETPTPEVKKGSVDVKYVTTDGKVLEDVTKVKDNVPVGESYTTEEKSFDGYHFVGMDKTSDSANGKVTEGDKHVVYVYEKNPETPTPEVKKGSVDVKYVTTDGKVLEDVTKVKDNAPVGEAYTTEEKSFDGYHFVGMDKTSDSANGKVTEGDKHVVYVYEKDETPEVKKGSVDVKYVTTDGKVLEDVTKVKDNAPVGEAYTTEEKSFDGYHFVGMDKTSDSANGKVTEGDKHVVYVYEKDVTPEVKKGSVDVKYVTTDGKVLEDVTKVKDNAPVGEAYTTEEKSFDGYHFVGMDKTSDSANGKVTEGDKHVVYVYEKDETPEVKKGSVDVKYVTTDGKVLEDVTKVKDNAPVGETYTTEEKSFDGYHFVGMDKTSDSANGKVTEGDKHVVYVYEKDETPEVKKGSVDVKYVTTDGKVLEDVTKVKDNAPVGEAYTTEEKSFDGYHFVGMDKTSDSANGKVTEGDKHIVYVYEKDETPEVKKGSVDVKYVTTDGKVLEDVTKVKDNVPVGETYTTEEKSFDGYHFVGMDKTSDSANGKVTEGDKHIVYVYEKDPEVPTTPVEKKGSVYVKYVDENGNELPGGEKTTVVKDGNVGSYYFTTEKDFDGYTFSHMAEGSSNPTGKVVEGDQQVVYVYTKNNTPQPEPNKPEVPTTPETPAVPQEEKTTTDTPVKTSTSKVNAEKVTVNKATVLPQTGDKKENNSSVMGLVSLGLAGLLGLGIKRKEEKDNH